MRRETGPRRYHGDAACRTEGGAGPGRGPVAFGGTLTLPPIFQHGPPVLPWPCATSPGAARHLLSERRPPFVLLPPGPSYILLRVLSPKTLPKGLLSFMSNQPKFVPHPQFDKLSSEAAIWEAFCCSSSFQKQNSVCSDFKSHHSFLCIPQLRSFKPD